jgi:flavin-dependent dehydrogenase
LSILSFDVVIAGGGPAGCATALMIRAHAPSLSVAIVEASNYERLRLGETLPPIAKRVLNHLQVWEKFQGQKHREVFGSAALWGSKILNENEFIYSARGSGWHLDRTQFDAMLAEEAKRRGVHVMLGKRVDRSIRDSETWSIRLSNDIGLQARFLVDATGRRARIARQQGVLPVVIDRLAGFAHFFEETYESDSRTLIEAFTDGWWYTAGLPDRQRIVVCMTDMDIAQKLHLTDPDVWRHHLDETTQIHHIINVSDPLGKMVVRATESRCLQPAAGTGWLAVGDAASIYDPLSSQGICKALRSGIFAAYAIADLLQYDNNSGMQRYCRYIREEFETYKEVRAKYYIEEQRWPEREFWQRRHRNLLCQF